MVPKPPTFERKRKGERLIFDLSVIYRSKVILLEK